MDEYINRKELASAVNVLKIAEAIAAANGKYKDCRVWAKAIRLLNDMATADAVPVVRCKDCQHSWLDISGRCCSYGVCVDSTVPDDFYCAYGKKVNKCLNSQ